MEDGIGAPNIADRTKVGDGKAIQVLGFVANGAEREAAVAEAESTAIPVVYGLYAGILQVAMDKVVAAVCGEVEPGGVGPSELEERLELLALD